jgi:hypothetical protein
MKKICSRGIWPVVLGHVGRGQSRNMYSGSVNGVWRTEVEFSLS